MKKFLAILLTLCLTASLFTSCGFGSNLSEYQEEELSYYEELAKAISEGDDDAYEKVVDEIKEYGKERVELLEKKNEIREDFNKDFDYDYENEKAGKYKEDLDEIREDEKVPSSTVDSFERAISMAKTVASVTINDADDYEEFYNDLREKVEEFIDVANSKDKEGARDLAKDLRDEYVNDYYDIEVYGDMEYDDKFGEIEDEYGVKIMNAVEAVYDAAYRYHNEDSLIGEDYDEEIRGMSKSEALKEARKNLACEKDIDDLEDDFDF